MKLRTKLVGGFAAVIALFLCLCVYQIMKLNGLSALQDEGAARADHAVEVKDIEIKFEGVYAHVADAVINRNLSEAAADLAKDRQVALLDVKALREIVDTAEEKAAIEEFSAVYTKYLDLAENRLLPLLRSGNADPAEISRLDDEIDSIRDRGESILETLSKSIHGEMEEGDKAFDAGSSSAKTVLIAVTLVIGLMAVGLGFAITISITGQVGGEPAEIAALAQRLASGDLVKREGDRDSAKATGISRSVLEMGESLRALLGPVNASMASLAASSEQLKSVAGDLRNGTGRTSQMANGVAAAAEEMQTNMHSVAAAVEQTNVNVSSVATAAEELTATITEIAQRASEARSKSEGAVSTSKGLDTVIANLTQSAEQIGRVTETIAEISEQTKLLALNATIEAARAGEAGKGFAVVAQEIKELARQVAAATGDISVRVEGIRQASEATKKGMSNVGGAIGEVNDMVMTIASAVEEQSITVSEISRNAAEVSGAVKESATLVAQTADVGAEVAKDVAILKDENDTLARGAQGLEESSAQLGAISTQMKEVVAKFRLH